MGSRHADLLPAIDLRPVVALIRYRGDAHQRGAHGALISGAIRVTGAADVGAERTPRGGASELGGFSIFGTGGSVFYHTRDIGRGVSPDLAPRPRHLRQRLPALGFGLPARKPRKQSTNSAVESPFL
jgi:hypothetical protein